MATAPREGFNLARSVGSGPMNGGLTEYNIASAYGTALGVGDLVKLTSGNVVVGANSAGNLGVLQGVQYTDSQGNIHITKYWPASTVAADAKALVMDHPLNTYHVKADGAIPPAVFYPGLMFALNLSAPDADTGRSTMTVDTIPTITGDVDIRNATDMGTDIAGVDDGDAFTIKTTAGEAATTITIGATETTASFLAQLNAVPNIEASVNGSGYLVIQSTNGYPITTVETVGNVITDLFAVASHTAAGGKSVSIASSAVKLIKVVDEDNQVMEVALTLPAILADS